MSNDLYEELDMVSSNIAMFDMKCRKWFKSFIEAEHVMLPSVENPDEKIPFKPTYLEWYDKDYAFKITSYSEHRPLDVVFKFNKEGGSFYTFYPQESFIREFFPANYVLTYDKWYLMFKRRLNTFMDFINDPTAVMTAFYQQLKTHENETIKITLNKPKEASVSLTIHDQSSDQEVIAKAYLDTEKSLGIVVSALCEVDFLEANKEAFEPIIKLLRNHAWFILHEKEVLEARVEFKQNVRREKLQ